VEPWERWLLAGVTLTGVLLLGAYQWAVRYLDQRDWSEV
jgi:hypothetical protein